MPATVQSGSNNRDVAYLQGLLNQLLTPAEMRAAGVSNPPLTTDGRFGPNTEKAVLAYKRRKGLTGGSVVGPTTWQHLERDAQSRGSGSGSGTSPAAATNPPAPAPRPQQPTAGSPASSAGRPSANRKRPASWVPPLNQGYLSQATGTLVALRGMVNETRAPTEAEQRDVTAFFEGYARTRYRDSRGYWTIGIGFNLERSNARSTIIQVLGQDLHGSLMSGGALSDQQIQALYRHDLDSHRRQVMRDVELERLPLVPQVICVDMGFNLGSLTGFPSFRRACNNWDWKEAAYQMFDSAWWGQVGRRSHILVDLMERMPMQS